MISNGSGETKMEVPGTSVTPQKGLFKMMVKKAMPPEVQKCLDNVVGFMKMEWPQFSEYIVHHVES